MTRHRKASHRMKSPLTSPRRSPVPINKRGRYTYGKNNSWANGITKKTGNNDNKRRPPPGQPDIIKLASLGSLRSRLRQNSIPNPVSTANNSTDSQANRNACTNVRKYGRNCKFCKTDWFKRNKLPVDLGGGHPVVAIPKMEDQPRPKTRKAKLQKIPQQPNNASDRDINIGTTTQIKMPKVSSNEDKKSNTNRDEPKPCTSKAAAAAASHENVNVKPETMAKSVKDNTVKQEALKDILLVKSTNVPLNEDPIQTNKDDNLVTLILTMLVNPNESQIILRSVPFVEVNTSCSLADIQTLNDDKAARAGRYRFNLNKMEPPHVLGRLSDKNGMDLDKDKKPASARAKSGQSGEE